MNSSTKDKKKYNVAILKLFEMILDLSEEQQQTLLEYAEQLFLKEKRISKRTPCHIPIYYASDDRVYSSYVKNISRHGLFIETDKPLPVGEEILMSFRLKGSNNPIKIKGEVAHSTRLGFGVKFKNSS